MAVAMPMRAAAIRHAYTLPARSGPAEQVRAEHERDARAAGFESMTQAEATQADIGRYEAGDLALFRNFGRWRVGVVMRPPGRRNLTVAWASPTGLDWYRRWSPKNPKAEVRVMRTSVPAGELLGWLPGGAAQTLRTVDQMAKVGNDEHDILVRMAADYFGDVTEPQWAKRVRREEQRGRKRKMPYLVRWEIDETAADPVAAARQALAAQRPGSTATVFDVSSRWSGNPWERVDLQADDPAQDGRTLDQLIDAAADERYQAGQRLARLLQARVMGRILATYPAARHAHLNGEYNDEGALRASLTRITGPVGMLLADDEDSTRELERAAADGTDGDSDGVAWTTFESLDQEVYSDLSWIAEIEDDDWLGDITLWLDHPSRYARMALAEAQAEAEARAESLAGETAA